MCGTGSTTASSGCPALPTRGRADFVAACWAGGSRAFVSHRAGAVFYELPGRRDDQLEITCPRWTRTVEPGLIVHESRRTPEQDVTVIDGIRIATPELTVLHLASLQPSPNYVEAVIHAGAAQAPHLLRLDARRPSCATATRLKGVARDSHRARALEPGERRRPRARWRHCCSRRCRAHGLPELVLQFEVLDQNGVFVARTDAALPAVEDHDRVPVDARASRRVPGRGRRPAAEPHPCGRLLPARRPDRRPAHRRTTSSPNRSAPSPAGRPDGHHANRRGQRCQKQRQTRQFGGSRTSCEPAWPALPEAPSNTPVRRRGLAQPGRPMVLVSRYSSKPATPCSRPRPLSL